MNCSIHEGLMSKLFNRKSKKKSSSKYTQEQIRTFENNAEDLYSKYFNKWKSIISSILSKSKMNKSAFDFDNNAYGFFYEEKNTVELSILFVDLYELYPNLREVYSSELLEPIYKVLRECVEGVNKYNNENGLAHIKLKIDDEGDWDDMCLRVVIGINALQNLDECSMFESVKFI